MEKTIILLCAMIAVVQYAFGQALEAKFENTDTRHVSVGAKDVVFNAHLNDGLMFLIENLVQIIRHDKDGEETVLTSGGKLEDGEPSFYKIDIMDQQGSLTIKFTIKEVRDIDDGKLEFRVTPPPGSKNFEMKSSVVEVVVVRPLDALKLKFPSQDPISESMLEPVAMDPGPYTVSCMAEGSNPATTDVHLFLNGNMQEHGEPVVEKMETGVRKFRTTITATVDISLENTGQELECRAKSMANDQHSTKMEIKINVYEPKVKCNETKAYVGEMYPVLTCVVNHEGLNIVDYQYQLGESGETIAAGAQNGDYMEVKKEDIGDGVTRVDLHLYKAQSWHFDTDFYLLIKHANGHVSRALVELKQAEDNSADTDDGGPGDSSSMLGASLVTLLMSIICTFLKSL